jgi:hypothetical protein
MKLRTIAANIRQRIAIAADQGPATLGYYDTASTAAPLDEIVRWTNKVANAPIALTAC